MERALKSVPADAQQHKDPAKLLQGLRDGVMLTNKTLEKVSLHDRCDISSSLPIPSSKCSTCAT